MKLYKCALFFTFFVSYIHCHEDMDMEMDMNMDNNQTDEGELVPIAHVGGHNHGMPILEMPLKPAEKLYWENYNTTTYFTFDETKFKHGIKKSFLKYHVFMIVTLTVISYPILLALNNINNKWYIFALIINFFFVISGMFSILVFHNQLKRNHIHLYENNCYSFLNILLTTLLSLHLISGIVKKSTEFYLFGEQKREVYDYEMLYMVPDSDERDNSLTENEENTRFSGETRNQSSSSDNENEPTSSSRYQMDLAAGGFNNSAKKLADKRNRFYKRVYSIPMIKTMSIHFHRLFSFIFNTLNYLILFYLFIHCGMGLAIGNLLGTPRVRIFNLLAHWIKGGVFMLLGIVSVSRYCGFGKNKSWGWNLSILKKSDYYNEITGKYNIPLWIRIFGKSGVSMEFVEVFLVFFYGSTNIFLERLASTGGAWTAKDLQHVSIAFLYLGAGLCGLLVEFYMRDTRYDLAIKQYKKIYEEENQREISKEELDDIIVANPGYSINPMGPFTIFWTGLLMSKHAQASQVSTAVHVQWGSLLTYGSPFRVFSMIYMMVFPANKVGKPQRPFTELISSFCLLSGGLIFMQSTDQVIEAMEYRGYTEMFTFNICLGFMSILMGWIIALFIAKDWLEAKQNENLETASDSP